MCENKGAESIGPPAAHPEQELRMTGIDWLKENLQRVLLLPAPVVEWLEGNRGGREFSWFEDWSVVVGMLPESIKRRNSIMIVTSTIAIIQHLFRGGW